MPRKTKSRKKPRKPYLSALVAILAICSTWNILADSKPGDNFFILEYRYGSTQEISGPDGCHGNECYGTAAGETDKAGFGFSLSHWFKDDLSVDFRAWVPSGDAGTDTLSGSLGLDYHFGHFYLPLNVGYWNDLDTLAFGTGAGVRLPIGSKIALRADAGIFYLDDADLDDRTAWKAGAGIGFGF